MDDSYNFQIFVDEAGNAGINYLDDDQPIHVSAGWLVGEDEFSAFERILTEAQRGRQGNELKSQQLLRRESGQQVVRDVIRALAECGACPLYVIAEREFCIAGKIVDILMDPKHNPAAAWLPTSEITQREELTAKLFEFSPELLANFARMYRTPTAEGMAACIRGLAEECRVRDLCNLADTLEGNLPVLDRVVRRENYDQGEERHYQWAALNAPMFIHTLRAADRIMDSHPGSSAHVVHDRNHQYDQVFAKTFEIVSHSGVGEVQFPDGVQRRLGVRHITSITPGDSQAIPGLQAADLLAGAVFRLAKDTQQGKEWPASLQEVGFRLFPDLLPGSQPMMGGVYGSDEFKCRLVGPFLRWLKETGKI